MDVNDPLIWLGILALMIVLFLIMRSLLLWYYRINEHIKLQHKTIAMLQKISIQLGDKSPEEITIKEVASGKKKVISIDEWAKICSDTSSNDIIVVSDKD